MNYKIIAEYMLGDIVLIFYECNGVVSSMIVPESCRNLISEKKLTLTEPLVQISLKGDRYIQPYARGLSLRNTETAYALQFVGHNCERIDDDIFITTEFSDDGKGISVKHVIVYRNSAALQSYVTVFNNSDEGVDIRMLSSFSLNGITPFEDGEAAEKLKMHRIRSYWSAEGRHECTPIDDLLMGTAWSKWGARNERFGQVGTLPVRKYFPFIAIEDTERHVTWAANVAWGGSWQLEAYRMKDNLALSGGLADYEFGHWNKCLSAGESYTTPSAFITVTEGGFEDACDRLLDHEAKTLVTPRTEEHLPIIYNEYCDTWNHPTEESVDKQLSSLDGMNVEYFVIDAGWFVTKDAANISDEWEINEKSFPSGMQYTVDKIKKAGMIPGIWFEFECAHINSTIFKEHPDWFVKQDGEIVISSGRAFLDFTKDEVIDYLKEKVIGFMKRYGFKYLKIDYNDTIGFGIDGKETVGENLVEHVKGIYGFLELIKAEIPDVIIENCASGGHRLEPRFMNLTSMSSFSDAHETKDIPIIASDIHRAVLPRQSQIWAVIRATDDARRIEYSMANAFLGRMCISGPIYALDPEQKDIIKQATELYRKTCKILREGRSHIYRSPIISASQASGWQVVIRENNDKTEALVICHRFSKDSNEVIDLPIDYLGGFKTVDAFGCSDSHLDISDSGISVHIPHAYSAKVFHLIKD